MINYICFLNYIMFEVVNMVDKREMLILTHLRRNARETLTRMSRKTSIPVSTIFEKLKNYESGLIKKHTSIIDFSKLGYTTKATILVKANSEHRERLKEYLFMNKSLNTVYKINNGYDFILEGIFKELKDVDIFLEKLEKEFFITDKYVYYIVDEIKKEDFLSSPEYVNMSSSF